MRGGGGGCNRYRAVLRIALSGFEPWPRKEKVVVFLVNALYCRYRTSLLPVYKRLKPVNVDAGWEGVG